MTQARTLIAVTKTCPVCGKTTTLNIFKNDYERWQTGDLIQNVFPYFTCIQRETLISGVCSDECWDILWDED